MALQAVNGEIVIKNARKLIGFLYLLFASPARADPTENPIATRPNVLLIVSEDNSEHLGCYGESRVHTPHLDRLASGGVRYTRAYVPYSVCSPSRAAFLTGLYTRQTGHIGLATHRFSMFQDFKTIPAYFQEAGYYTGFLGKTHVNPERLVEDHIDHRAIPQSNFNKAISIQQYAEEASLVMQGAKKRDKPFLLIVNYADAHRSYIGKSKAGFPSRHIEDSVEPFPWIGSDSEHLRMEIRDCFNCINRLDEGIGMVLDRMVQAGVRENTLVIYISDHGADFPRGKVSVYEHGTRIPMILIISPEEGLRTHLSQPSISCPRCFTLRICRFLNSCQVLLCKKLKLRASRSESTSIHLQPGHRPDCFTFNLESVTSDLN